jgi:DNA replicative helicase MCM subunit Mcm2 (Cdc46/Mcm family)
MLILDPLRHLRALESIVHDIGLEERPGYDVKLNGERVKVAIGGPVGGRASSPRELGSSELRRLICVEGVAVKVSYNLEGGCF